MIGPVKEAAERLKKTEDVALDEYAKVAALYSQYYFESWVQAGQYPPLVSARDRLEEAKQKNPWAIADSPKTLISDTQATYDKSKKQAQTLWENVQSDHSGKTFEQWAKKDFPTFGLAQRALAALEAYKK